ncbi:MAG: anthranilate synthase component I [Porticoccus sp.]|jgi:anthranilate synthase component 1|nr:anthranilate synthase component I [Porticoccus sp.]
MTPEKFAELAGQNYSLIPVIREVVADLETPLSCYLKLAKGPYSYLFESVEGGEKWGRYSLIGLPSDTILKVSGNKLMIEKNNKVIESKTTKDPLAYIEKFQAKYQIPDLPDLPRFTGGLVGYFGYDVVRYIEEKLRVSTPKDDLGNPDILLIVSDEVVVFDNLLGKLILVVHQKASDTDAWIKSQKKLDELELKLKEPVPNLPPLNSSSEGKNESNFISSFGKENFLAAVQKIKNYVLAGDVMQVVPSQRLSIEFEGEPLNLYRALRSLNPSPYMYFLDMNTFQIVGSSPEILARLEDGEVTVRPIAGTRRRGRNPQEDISLENELINDPKEIAEHLMLIDLGRNDVGKVSQTGTVKLTDQMVVERYSHVMHITSNVTGQVIPTTTAMSVLRATLPAGTLSGAPKIRAMEIIDEIEPVKRGVYGGAIGYISWNGNMDTAIAIRTAVIKDGKLYVQAGAGIVADSLPELEWKETINKARAIFRAVDLVI